MGEVLKVMLRKRRWWLSLLVKIEGDTLNTQHGSTDPFKPRTDVSLVLYRPYLQQRCTVHPRHPACAQLNGANFPIGADRSESLFASS